MQEETKPAREAVRVSPGEAPSGTGTRSEADHITRNAWGSYSDEELREMYAAEERRREA